MIAESIEHSNMRCADRARKRLIQSLPNNSLPSSLKLISTTTADPASPTKNITSSSRMKRGKTIASIVPLSGAAIANHLRMKLLRMPDVRSTVARIRRHSAPLPNAINSALYARLLEIGSLEVVGRGRPLRRPARVAVSARRAAAPLAHRLCLVRPGSAAVGAAFAAAAPTAPPAAPRFSARLSLRRPLVHGQLLLGARHHAALRRYAAAGARRCCCSASAWFWGSTLASSAWALRWCAAPPAARGWRWPPRPFCGPRWNWPPRASPAFPGTSSATRRWTTRWSTSLPPGPAFTASALCWSP